MEYIIRDSISLIILLRNRNKCEFQAIVHDREILNYIVRFFVEFHISLIKMQYKYCLIKLFFNT